MPHSLDISWPVLRRIVRDWAGESVELAEVARLCGGAISTALCLTLSDGNRAVLKITPHRVDRTYEDEKHQLALLREADVPVPDVFRCHTGSLDEPFSYILMQFVEGVDLAAARAACSAVQFEQLQAELATLVLRLHERAAPHYMRCTAAQPRRYESWPICYRDIFDPIWSEVEKSSALQVKARKTVNRIHERLDRLLAHADCPRLVHWDLWSTNILAHCDSSGVWRITALLDPNCKYAHAEAEIAYLELFQTITPAFLKAYQQSQKLPVEYHRVRKPVYQLYSLLNHLRLFGSEYLKPLNAAIERAGALV